MSDYDNYMAGFCSALIAIGLLLLALRACGYGG